MSNKTLIGLSIVLFSSSLFARGSLSQTGFGDTCELAGYNAVEKTMTSCLSDSNKIITSYSFSKCVELNDGSYITNLYYNCEYFYNYLEDDNLWDLNKDIWNWNF